MKQTVAVMDESNKRLGYKIINIEELQPDDQVIPQDEFQEMLDEKKKDQELEADPQKALIDSLEKEVSKLKIENANLKKELSAPKKVSAKGKK